MRYLYALLVPVVALACVAASATERATLANPADSVEYVIAWPAASGPVGVDSYVVAWTQGTVSVTHTALGLADSFNVVKPPFGPTAYPFSAVVTPYAADQAGAPLSVAWSYERPSPAPAFPEGAVIVVDSSKITRP